MLAFLDFEASSLARHSYPIEVAWVFEDGRSEAFLIRPAAAWTDWDPAAEAIHRISRTTLKRDGIAHDVVAGRMLEALAGHDLFASAPSWDGKWLSALLRAADYPRHSLRLRDSEEALLEAATRILAPVVPPDELGSVVGALIAKIEVRPKGLPPAHRALADAIEERDRWLAVKAAAEKLAVGMARG